MRTEDQPTSSAIDWAGILKYIVIAGQKHTPIKRGSTGEWVALAQKRLNDRGADLKVDGIYGRKSVNACKKWQKQFATRADGVIDSNTWRLLWTT